VSASDDYKVRLWDTVSGALLHTLDCIEGWIYAVAFSPDGKQLASASGAKVRIWDTGSAALLHTLDGHSEGVFAVAFSPDGKLLVSASSDKTVRLWPIGYITLF
jgi:WD40 repeat protein